ncbi:MAG: hypothetical protein M3295_01055 [Chloroflexota bacterium]|nr:hypothetical protein [Chloroflexota bacterium]
MTDPAVNNGPFGGFDVERVTRADGRYLLYYSWHESGQPAPGGAPPTRVADRERNDEAAQRSDDRSTTATSDADV